VHRPSIIGDYRAPKNWMDQKKQEVSNLSKAPAMDRFLARQPILTADRRVFGYEILSRFSPENYCRPLQGEEMHVGAMDELFLMGLRQMTQGLPAFINCSREFLLRGYLELLPHDHIVGEILESVKPEPEVVAACRRFKDKGYRLALDDYVDAPGMDVLFGMTDFVKVDFLSTSLSEQARLGQKFHALKIPLIAEKVETIDQFQRGVDMGYQLFQGYFFCRPQIVGRRNVPANKLMYLRLIALLAKPEFDMKAVIAILKQDLSLSYRLMRYLNSPAFAMAVEIHSIPHALTLLGENATRKWLSLVCLSSLGGKESFETIKVALIRALLRITGGENFLERSRGRFVPGGPALGDGCVAECAHDGGAGDHVAGAGPF